jgi:hypothetical protein
MHLVDPTNLYLEINDAAAEIREAPVVTEAWWLQVEGRIDDFINRLELMGRSVVDRSKGARAVDWVTNAGKALEHVRNAREWALKRAARPTAGALGRASLELRS